MLLEGSIVQLRHYPVVRNQDENLAITTHMEMRTFKFTVWKDKWHGKWNEFTIFPVKKLTEAIPRLLCKGKRDGKEYKKIHPPVGSELD